MSCQVYCYMYIMTGELLGFCVDGRVKMLQLHHRNLNEFIGAYISLPAVYICMTFCAKSSIWDVIKQQSTLLSWDFRMSLIIDIAKVFRNFCSLLLRSCISVSKDCMALYHRLNGSSSPVLTVTPHSYGKGQNSTPCKIKTPERIRMKFCTVDYVLEVSPHNKFGDDRSSGGFWVNM